MNREIAGDSRAIEAVEEYYAALGFEADVPLNALQYASSLCKRNGKRVLLLDRRWLKAPAKFLGLPYQTTSEAVKQADQRLALYEALLLLNKKGVACFFCNRVGLKKDGFAYSESAQRRMENKESFPALSRDPEKHAHDFRELLGEKYSPEYVDELCKLPQMVEKNGRYAHEDSCSNLVNVVGGLRVTANQPKAGTKTVHVYGRCGAFGYAVEDGETMPSFLQQYLNGACGDKVKVVNHGLWGGEDEHVFRNFLVDSQKFGENDVVLYYMRHLPPSETALIESLGVTYFDITDEWHARPEAAWCFYDKPGHMNRDGYRNVAEIVGSRLLQDGFAEGEVVCSDPSRFESAAHYNEYLRGGDDQALSADIDGYLKTVIEGYPIQDPGTTCGAIVMNCNPFTKGHRYLVEYAVEQVDLLYLFVVEEDRSVFSFEDRFLMVEKGVADIGNVRVCPSGRFMISTLTFPEYFLKDYVKEKDFDASMDLDIFCSRIAPALNITVRFAGEEPTDPVTARYNESMAEMLPGYGMVFCEIPRLMVSEEEALSATKVRKLMSGGDIEELKRYVPETTLNILIEKYIEK